MKAAKAAKKAAKNRRRRVLQIAELRSAQPDRATGARALPRLSDSLRRTGFREHAHEGQDNRARGPGEGRSIQRGAALGRRICDVEYDKEAFQTVDAIAQAGDEGWVVELTFSGAQSSISAAFGVSPPTTRITGASVISHSETSASARR